MNCRQGWANLGFSLAMGLACGVALAQEGAEPRVSRTDGGIVYVNADDVDKALLADIEAAFCLGPSSAQSECRSPQELHLAGKGGDIAVGLEIAKLVWDLTIPTFVDDGAACESACAVIFMSGQDSGRGEGPNATARFLDVGGSLGFHAPFIRALPDISYSNNEVRGAQRSAFAIISTMLLGSTAAKWPPSLVGKMLAAGPNAEDLVRVETVDDAGRWHISLTGVEGVRQTGPSAYYIACLNGYRWLHDEYANLGIDWLGEDFEAGLERDGSDMTKVDIGDAKDPHLVDELMFDGMNGLTCQFDHDGDGTWMAVDGSDGFFPLESYYFVNPNTTLQSLQDRRTK